MQVWPVEYQNTITFIRIRKILKYCSPVPLKLRPYGAIQICVLLLLLFFDPDTQFAGNEKITLRNTKKYKYQAGMNLTPSPPSQNSHPVRWHCTAESERRVAEINKKLSYRWVTARCVLSVVILPIATQQCRNYLYDKSWPNWWYEVGGLVGGNVSWTMCTQPWRDRVGFHCLGCHKQTDDGRIVYITCIPTTCWGEIF